MDYKISEESAEQQLSIFHEWYDLDPSDFEEISSSDSAAQSAYRIVRRRLIRAIRKGYLEIREESSKDGQTLVVEQTLVHPIDNTSKITYGEVTGFSRVAVKEEVGDNATRKNYKALAALAKEPPKLFEKFRGPDVGVADCLGFLFAQV